MDDLDKKLIKRDEILALLKQNLCAAVNRMKQTADKKHMDVSFEEGDYVFLKLQSYRQQSAYKRAHQKLASRFYGPYQIAKCVGSVAYKLILPERVQVHPIFHVSLLKKVIGDHVSASSNLPPSNEDGVIEIESEVIMDTRWIKKGPKFVEKSLIKWRMLLGKSRRF